MTAFAEVWRALEKHHQNTQHIHLRERFAADDCRFGNMHETLGGLLFDYSKNRVDEETLQLLCRLAAAADLGGKMRAMRSGGKINASERRAVLHTALRLPRGADAVYVDGENVLPQLHGELDRALAFAQSVADGILTGASGQVFTDWVHIGIGGSDLGARMCVQALRPYRGRIGVHFAANSDAADLAEILCRLNPHTTMFSIASKSFKTPETLMNAQAAKQWCMRGGLSEADTARHFCAVSADTDAAVCFGIPAERVFAVSDWVGGRYSVWSPVGLPVMAAVGEARFREFLAGAHAMDVHFFDTPLRRNIPVLMALLNIWYLNFQKADGQTVVPYSHDLRLLPSWLNQLDMESLGKRQTSDGKPVEYQTGGIVFGEEGVNCQHAYFQLLHQGTRLIPCDFVVPLVSHEDNGRRQRFTVANAFAQSEALMKGKTPQEVQAELADLPEAEQCRLVPQKTFPGNAPSNSILLDKLSPFNLGMLMAAYEHRTFVQGAVWNINPFDQWGVEYGKQLAQTIESELAGGICTQHDGSTEGLMAFYRHCCSGEKQAVNP